MQDRFGLIVERVPERRVTRGSSLSDLPQPGKPIAASDFLGWIRSRRDATAEIDLKPERIRQVGDE